MNLQSLWFWDYVLYATKKTQDFGLRKQLRFEYQWLSKQMLQRYV